MRGMSGGIRTTANSKFVVSLYELLKSYSNHVMKKSFLSINIPLLPVCRTEEATDIIKKNIKSLNDWKEMFDMIPDKFKKNKNLRKSGIAGFFSASLELTKEGLINIMQKKNFDKLLIKERK
jgi:segregation and condensation protein A